MADRSFDEQVRQQLTGLQLKPEEQVWVSIEANLRKEKKNRWLIWLFLFTALGGSGALFLLNHGSIQQKQAVLVSNKLQANNMRTLKNSVGDKEKKDGTKEPGNETLSNKIVSEKNIATRSTYVPVQITMEKRSAKDEIKKETSIDVDRGEDMVSVITDTKEKNINTQNTSPAVIIAEVPAVTEKAVLPLKDSSDYVANTPTNDKAGQPKKITKYPWTFYTILDMGKSGAEGLFNNGNAFSSSGFLNSFPGNNIGISAGAAPGLPSLQNAFSFGVTLEANKQFSKTESIGLSLGYQLLQSKIGVGPRVNGTVIIADLNKPNDDGFYYSNTNQQLYTNHYHFVQAGISLYSQFKMSKALSLRWQLGAAGGWLFASNALHYDGNRDILFKNKSSLHALQVSLSTGFDIGVGKTPVIYFGPQIMYFLPSISVMPNADGQHLSRLGVRMSVPILKRKK